MAGLVIEYADKADLRRTDVPFEPGGMLRLPQHDYIELIEAARQIRADWLLREGAELVCESCKSFILPAVSSRHLPAIRPPPRPAGNSAVA